MCELLFVGLPCACMSHYNTGCTLNTLGFDDEACVYCCFLLLTPQLFASFEPFFLSTCMFGFFLLCLHITVQPYHKLIQFISSSPH